VQIGAILAGRFLVERAASTEESGQLRAADQVLGGKVVVQLVEVPRGDLVDRFLLEAVTLAGLDHPALARHTAHGHIDGRLYLAAAHVEGESIHQRLLRGPLAPPDALRLVARVAEAVAYAHRRGVVHLDLHPRRVILRAGGEPALALPGGAWLAALASPPFAPDESPYLAPERLTGQRPGPATDAFALGVLLYCCLAGHPPYLGATPLASQAKILLDDPPRLPAAEVPWPPRLAALLASLLARDPGLRPTDLARLALALADPGLLDAAGAPPEPATIGSRERRLASLLAVGDPRQDADLGPALALLAGAHVVDLAGRVLLASFHAGSLPEALDAAARVALSIRERMPMLPLALATGYGPEGSGFPGGEALDRVAALAHADAPDGAMGRRRRAQQTDAPCAVRLDTLSRAVLAPRWAVDQDDFGFCLRSERPGAAITPDEAPAELPLALEQHRLDALSPPERRLLRALSLLDRPFPRELAAALVGPGHDEAWGALVARAYLQVDERSLAAGRVLYRAEDAAPIRAALGSLFDEDRRLGHRLAARWLADHGGTADERLPHLDAAGDRPGAQQACLQAAREALARHDLDGSLAWAERGEGLGDHPSTPALLVLRAELHRWLGQPIHARKAALRAIDARQGAPLLPALGEIADASALIGDGRRVQAVSRRIEAATAPGTEAPDGAHLIARARASLALFALGYPDLADEQLGAASLAAGDDPGPLARAWLLRARARRAQLSGFPAARLALCRAAGSAFAAADNDREALAEDIHLAFAHLDLGLDVQASTLASRAAGQARQAGLVGVEALGKVALGLCLGRLGSFAEARALLREAAAFFSGRGDKAHEGQARVSLAIVLLADGDPARARREAERACLVLDPVPPLQVPALSVHGQAALAEGDTERALGLARAAHKLAAARRGMVEGATLATLIEATALHLSGQRPAALALLTQAEQRILEQAATIADPTHAQAYLRGVPEHARTLDLARLWSALPGPVDGDDPVG
jgi:hypothetical protein